MALWQQTRNSSGSYDVDIPDTGAITQAMVDASPAVAAVMAAQETAGIDAPAGISVSFSGTIEAGDIISGGEGQDVLLGGTFTETSEDNLAGWVERTTVVEESVVVEQTVALNDGTAVTRTRNPAAAVDDPNPWLTTVKLPDDNTIDGANIGLAFGSSIGQALGGSNPFARVAAGTLLGATLENVGQAFGYSLDRNVDVETAFEQVAPQFGSNLVGAFRSQAVGAVSSFLTGELMDSLHVGNSFGGQLLRSVTGTVTSRVLDNAVNIATNGASVDTLLTGLAGNIGSGLSSFVGGWLAHEIVAPQNLGGSIGSSIGGAVGSAIGTAMAGVEGVLGSIGTAILSSVGITAAVIQGSSLLLNFILPGVGALIGAVLGTLAGNLLGGLFSDEGHGNFSMVIQPAAKAITDGLNSTDDWDFGRPPHDTRDAAKAMANSILGAIGGKVAATGAVLLVSPAGSSRRLRFRRGMSGLARGLDPANALLPMTARWGGNTGGWPMRLEGREDARGGRGGRGDARAARAVRGVLSRVFARVRQGDLARSRRLYATLSGSFSTTLTPLSSSQVSSNSPGPGTCI